MGRDQRNRRRGVVMRNSMQPQPDPDYWKKRAMHFEQALLAAVASCPGRELEVLNQDLTGYLLDADELLTENGERRGVRFRVRGGPGKAVPVDSVKQPNGEEVVFVPIIKEKTDKELMAKAFEEQIKPTFKVVDKRRAVGPTTVSILSVDEVLPLDEHGAHDCPESHPDACRERQCNLRGVKFYGD